MIVTLANLADATPQQVFTQVATHLLKQNQPSKQKGAMCAYRGDDKMMCAAGCLIADDEYKPEMDTPGKAKGETHATGSDWASLIRRELIPTDTHEDLIIELQSIHDNVPVCSWKHQLELVANYNKFEMPSV